MTREAITLIQRGLAGLGYDPGKADGLYGPKTGAAAATWVKADGKAAGAAAPPPLKPETTSVIYQGSARYPVREVIIHCSATTPDWMARATLAEKRAEIRRWHMMDKGWKDIGYHWLIDRDGKMTPGRLETVIGAHVEGHNAGTIGICLIGGHGSAATDHIRDHFTGSQVVSLRHLLQGIGMRTAITKVTGHNEYAAKACPGFNAAKWFKGDSTYD